MKTTDHPQQTFKLADIACYPTLYKIASMELRFKPEYFCMFNGVRTKIVK